MATYNAPDVYFDNAKEGSSVGIISGGRETGLYKDDSAVTAVTTDVCKFGVGSPKLGLLLNNNSSRINSGVISVPDSYDKVTQNGVTSVVFPLYVDI